MGSSSARASYSRDIIIASGNRDKIGELKTIANGLPIELHWPKDIAIKYNLSPPPEVEEIADTYHGNAKLKAEAFCRWAKMPALADDSGLEVLALGGRPGVKSARYAGEDTPHSEKILQLVAELNDAIERDASLDRAAKFCCSLVLAYPNGAVLSSYSELLGEILTEPRGDAGFGYDPIVLINEFGKTLAEVDFKFTCEQGFRARAAQELFAQVLALKP